MIVHGMLILLAYVIGAIPTGFVIARLKGIRDITKRGSGNIGATNVARVLGKRYFFLIFFLDTLKACGYLLLLRHCGFTKLPLFLSALALLFGNGCSIFLNGRGGKGIATSFGLVLSYEPFLLFGLVLVWLSALFVTRTVGIASVSAVVAAPLVAHFFIPHDMYLWYLVLIISVWCVYRHTDNIYRFVRKWSLAGMRKGA